MRKILCAIIGLLFTIPAHAALPTGYTELEYIQTDGGSWIDTGIIPTATKLQVDYKMQLLERSYISFFGSVASSNPRNGLRIYYQPDTDASAYSVQSGAFGERIPFTWNDVLQGTVVATDGTSLTDTINGVSRTYTTNNINLTNPDSICVGTTHLGDGTSGRAPSKIWYFRIVKNDVIAFNGIPARRNSDSAIGMYDTVSGTFFENAGTGSFIAGPIACEGERVAYTSATGTVTQNGTPTPTNPIEPVFYQQGNMVLRKVGDIADSYDATTGKITRRVGVKVLDGTENWGSNTYGTYGKRFYTSISGLKGYVDGLSTHYGNILFIEGSGLPGPNNTIFLGGVTESVAGPFVRDDRFTAIPDFKSYLAQQYNAGTPVTIYYPLKEETTEDWTGGTSYCQQAIKVATTKYVESQFGGLSASLAAAVQTVNTVVTNTITQAASIATLQSGKQTRPADDTCPAYKQCLLVEDEQGVPHWYQITDPFRDFVAPIIANNVAPASTTAQPGFTQLEYIESDGNSWIDTGIIAKQPFDTKLGVSFADNNNRYLFGISNASPGYCGRRDNGRFELNNTFTSMLGKKDEKYELHYYTTSNGTFFEIKGPDNETETLEVRTIASAEDSTISWKIMNNMDASTLKGNIYYAQISQSGKLLFNGIPAKRNSDSAIGMYDTVTKTFFANAGSGTFTAGPTVANTDVPANPTWAATWAANATTGVSAGTVYGEGLCNASTGDATPITDSGWNTAGPRCWCKMVGLESDGEYNSTTDEKWAFADSLGSSCATNCASACLTRLNSTPGFRSALFGM